MIFFATADIHEIAPPVDYSLVPPWVVYLGIALGLALLGIGTGTVHSTLVAVPARSTPRRA